jgi:phage baseplate assembly protein gpV
MKTYEFDVILKQIAEITDDQADALFVAGCDDGSPVSCDGLAWVHFDREAHSLEEAIRSVVVQVQSAGFAVSKVELTVDSPIASEA